MECSLVIEEVQSWLYIDKDNKFIVGGLWRGAYRVVRSFVGGVNWSSKEVSAGQAEQDRRDVAFVQLINLYIQKQSVNKSSKLQQKSSLWKDRNATKASTLILFIILLVILLVVEIFMNWVELSL